MSSPSAGAICCSTWAPPRQGSVPEIHASSRSFHNHLTMPAPVASLVPSYRQSNVCSPCQAYMLQFLSSVAGEDIHRCTQMCSSPSQCPPSYAAGWRSPHSPRNDRMLQHTFRSGNDTRPLAKRKPKYCIVSERNVSASPPDTRIPCILHVFSHWLSF